jgi:hypothetical protein
MNASTVCRNPNSIAYTGFSATNICGDFATETSPISPSSRNQSTMIGPNSRPTTCVPCFWIKNRAISTISARGSTHFCSAGAMISMPSMAESTEMAGVMTASP